MRLKKYTRSDCKYRMPGQPSVNIREGGPISFNKTISESIGLKDGDKIVFLQDEIRPMDWYISKTENDDGFVLRGKIKTSSSLITNSATVARAILKSVGSIKKATFRMSEKPTEVDGKKYFAILTKVPNNEK